MAKKQQTPGRMSGRRGPGAERDEQSFGMSASDDEFVDIETEDDDEQSKTRELMERGREAVGDAAETAREWAADARDAATNAARRTRETIAPVAQSIGQNPWPAVLIGAGLTWLIVDSTRGRRMPQSSPREPRREGAGQSGPPSRRRMRMTQTMQTAQTRVERMVRERPLVAGAAALGIGAAVSMMLPKTEREDELLGETRDAVVDRAKDVARNTVQAAQGVVDSVKQLTGRPPSR
jgi:ElaB/YqjD/DUF883 family membrane-anchored ribosome-binding protein